MCFELAVISALNAIETECCVNRLCYYNLLFDAWGCCCCCCYCFLATMTENQIIQSNTSKDMALNAIHSVISSTNNCNRDLDLCFAINRSSFSRIQRYFVHCNVRILWETKKKLFSMQCFTHFNLFLCHWKFIAYFFWVSCLIYRFTWIHWQWQTVRIPAMIRNVM